MRLSARRVVVAAFWLTVGVAPAMAAAQGSTPAASPPPPGGGPTTPVESTPLKASDEKKEEEKKRDVGGYAYSDKPAPRDTRARRAVHRTGPFATFPGFEQRPDGGSRVLVRLSHAVPVEERRAEGSVTYVLKGAHIRVSNDANALVTVHFNTPVFRARLIPSGRDLLFVLELRAAASPTFQITANEDKTATLAIDFAKGEFLKGDGSETIPSQPRPPARSKSTKRVR